MRLRVKSQTMAMLGQDIVPSRDTSQNMPQDDASKDAAKEQADKNPLNSVPGAVNLLKGLFGR